MTRSDFLRISSLFGLGIPFSKLVSSCKVEEVSEAKFEGKVLIIGAGAGGLSAGYFLKQKGIDFEILEASSTYGGRMKINTDFADFPIPLGAEWLETKASIFSEIVNNPAVEVNIETVPDSPDYKFVNYSWFNFFDEYIFPSISDQIIYNSPVESIDYSAEKVVVKTSHKSFEAEKVIISVPLKMLQLGKIAFVPALPKVKQDSIDKANIWDGFKAFFEFSENFYGKAYEKAVQADETGQKIYYDACLGQKSSKNVLGLFAVGKPAAALAVLDSEALKSSVLAELDATFSNKASRSYLTHISQNWNEEPFIGGGYLSDYEDWKLVRELGKPVNSKLFFAGGAYTDGEDWVSVHTAAQSARRAVEEALA